MTTLPLLLLALLPVDFVARESCEVIEINHLYDDAGRETLCQWIAWGSGGRCLAWRMNNERRLDPVHNESWFMDDGRVRSVRARTVIETWLMYDPELADRELLPANQRRGLRK